MKRISNYDVDMVVRVLRNCNALIPFSTDVRTADTKRKIKLLIGKLGKLKDTKR